MVNILRTKDNQTMKFGQLIEHNNRNIFLQKSCRKWGRETSSRPLFNFFNKTFMLGKSKWSATRFHYVSIALKLAYNKNKLFKILHLWSRDMLNFDFLDKGLGKVSPPHLAHEFSTKIASSCILIINQISMPGCFYVLKY